MAAEKLCFKDYMSCPDDKMLSKTRKKMNRKRKDGSSKNVYGWAGYGPPPGISGAPAGGGASGGDGGAAAGGGGVGESYQLAEPTGSRDIKNVFKYRKRGASFLDFINDENEEDYDRDMDDMDDMEDRDMSIDDEMDRDMNSEPEFDDDIYDLIMDLQDDGMDVDEIADETDLSVEEIQDYLDNYKAKDDMDADPDDMDMDIDADPDEMDMEDEEAFDLDAALANSRFANRGPKLTDDDADAMERTHDRLRKERGGLRGGGYSPEDEEDSDYDSMMRAFDRNRDGRDEYEQEYGDAVPPEEADRHVDGEMDEPEYADEVQAGDWTISRIDQDDDFAEDGYDDQDRDEYERSYEEEDYEYAEDAEEPSKKDQARALYRAMKSGEYTRKDIISAFEKRLQLSPSSSTAYYERIAKEYGETEQQGRADGMSQVPGLGRAGIGMGMGMLGDEEMQGEEEPDFQDPQEWDDPHRQGVIRTVNNAHLVFKRQTDDGSFEELWLYKEGEQFKNELDIRNDIKAGTDIPVNKTSSPDGSQKSETWSVGDVQYMSITGLPN